MNSIHDKEDTFAILDKIIKMKSLLFVCLLSVYYTIINYA